MQYTDKEQATELFDWWVGYATDEIDAMMDKLMEYGLGDLHEMGRQMIELGVAGDPTDLQLQYEYGIMFYALGKIQRVLSAAKIGRPASDDTWHDLAVYAKMVLAMREGVMPV